MRLLGVLYKIFSHRRGYGCCHEDEYMQPSPCPCPKTPFWTGKTVTLFALLTFGAGIYTGIYISQNYEVPPVDDPPKLIERLNQKLRDMMQDKKKNAAEQIVHDIKKEAKKILDD